MRQKLDRNLVVDASVSLKWYIDDEECVNSARKLLKDYGDGKIIIRVPDFFFVEIGNVLNVAVMRKRLKEKDAIEFLENVLKLGITTVSCSELLTSAWKIARANECSIYDSVYVAEAYLLGCDLYTGDKRLYNALRAKIPLIKWIGDYEWENGNK